MAGISPYRGYAAATPGSFSKGGAGSAWPFQSDNDSRHLYTLFAGGTEGRSFTVEPSTVKGYQDIWKVHVQKNPVAKIRLRDFTAKNGQQFLESLPQNLSHQTHLRIKNFLRGVLTWAITSKALTGSNPMEETKAGGRTKKEGLTLREKKIRASHEHAYTLEEVADMLDKLPEPARTVCAVAAFTGLTRSELKV